jgi:tryptophan 2,3-dioxygenase
MTGDTRTYFANVPDKNILRKMQEEGELKLSYRATWADLFISLYRDVLILHLPYKLLSVLTETADLLSRRRSTHALMVMWMLGKKIGTAGSSGHE